MPKVSWKRTDYCPWCKKKTKHTCFINPIDSTREWVCNACERHIDHPEVRNDA